MADNRTLGTPAGLSSGTGVLLYEIASFSGDSNLVVAPTVLGVIAGAEGSRTFTAVDDTNPLPIDDAGGSITVDGTVSVSGSVTVADGGSSISVDDNGGSLTVDGTVAATQSGTWSARLQDGSGNALTSALRGSERAISVQIIDGSGAQITSFGGSGGTASNLGSAVPAQATAAGFSDGTNLQAARVFDADSGAGSEYLQGVLIRAVASGGSAAIGGDAANGLDVDVTRVSGTVTVSATNLSCNTAQINGVAPSMGNGVSGTGVQRVTIASDSTGQVTLAAGSNTIGALTANQSVNISQMNGVTVTMNNGVAGTGVQRVTLASDSTGNIATIGTSVTPGTGATNLGKAEDAAHTTGDVGVMALAVRQDTLGTPLAGASGDYIPLITDSTGALVVTGSAGTAVQTDDAAFTPGTSKVAVVGLVADETATDSVDEGDAGAARMTLDRKQIVTPYPHTAGGLDTFRSLDLDETEEDVKTSAGQLYGWYISNSATSARYVKLYNATAASVTVGSTTPMLTILVPGAASGGVAANALGAHGITFSTAICAAATTGATDADTGAPGANEVIVNLFYK